MGNEVRWSFFLNDLALTMPRGVSLETLAVTSPEPGATPPGGRPLVGGPRTRGHRRALGSPAWAR